MADVDLRRLRYLVVLARERHFGRAAEALGISQPSLSQGIARLEREVGAPLVDREQRPVDLTPAGRALVHGAAPALKALDRAVRAARRTAGARHRLVLAVPRVEFALHPAVRGLLTRTRERLPGWEVQLSPLLTREALDALREGSADAAVVYTSVDLDDVEVTPLFHDEPVVIMPAGHRLARREGVTIADLAAETIVTWSPREMPSVAEAIEAACRREGFVPRLAEAPPEPGALGGMVADGVGVALVSGVWARGWRGGDLVARPLTRPRIVLSVVLVWPREADGPAVRALAAAAQAGAGGLSAPSPAP